MIYEITRNQSSNSLAYKITAIFFWKYVMTLDHINEKFRLRTTMPMSVEKENQILLDTLEEFAEGGGWFVNLLNMEFSALGNKVYDI